MKLLSQTLLLAALITGSACGGGGGDPLEGTWMTASTVQECISGFTFEGGTFELDIICELNSGDIGMEVWIGDYSADDDTVSLTSTHSSCPNGEASTISLGYEVDGDSLRIVDDSGLAVLIRQEDDGMPPTIGLTVSFGCYDEEGFFTRHDIEAL